MKKTILISILIMSSISALLFSIFGFSRAGEKIAPKTPIYGYSINGIDGKNINLEQYKGKKILFVNVASECGFTTQYKELQELHQKYGSKVTVIGFPCNQFGGQEPGTAKEISTFCEKNFGVSFPLTEKIDVKGENQHSIYAWLTKKELNGKLDSDVKWNFQKYLVDENGYLVDVFYSATSPTSDKITSLLDK